MKTTDGAGTVAWGSIPTTPALSSITAATIGVPTLTAINNTNYAQEWQWNSLSGKSAFTLSSTSSALATGDAILNVNLNGTLTPVLPTDASYAAKFSNTNIGSGHNYGLSASAGSTDATENYGVQGYANGSNAGATNIGVYAFANGTNGTNIGLKASASGPIGPTYYAALFTAGKVGIGTSAPTALFSVGSDSPSVSAFTVAANGNTVTSGTIASGAHTITSTASTALAVAASGSNYGLQVDESTGSAVTGLKITSAAAAGGLALATISSGTNESMTLNAKGSGTISIGNSSTGNLVLGSGGGNVGVGATPLDALSIGTAINANSAHALLNLSNTALSGGSSNGTYIGANPTSFSGNFFDFWFF